MILHFMGGHLNDGTAIDTDAPGNWGGVPRGFDDLEQTVQVNCARSNIQIYELAGVFDDEAIYVFDAKQTDMAQRVG